MTSVKKNFLYNSFYQILLILVPLITTPYISRVLGPGKLGIYSYHYSIATYFVTFAMLGLNNYGNRTIAGVRDNKEKLSKTFFEIYAMQVGISVIVLGIYIVYALTYGDSVMGMVMVLYVASAALDINWFFYGLELFKLTTIRNTIIKFITTVSIFVFVKSREDVYIYGLIMVTGIFVSQAALWPFVRRYVHFTKIEFRQVVSHIKPNVILFIPAVAVTIYKLMDKIMLGAFTTMTEVGFYESSEKLVQIPTALVVSLGTVMLPKMANLAANKDTSQMEAYLRKSFIAAAFLSTSLGLGIVSVADGIVPIFYGAGYEKCILLLRIILPSCIFVAFANVIRTEYLIPQKKDKIYIQSVFLGAIVNVIVNLALIREYASVGVSVGTLCAEASVCIFQAAMVRKDLPIASYIKDSLPFLVAGILMTIVTVNVHFQGWNMVGELFLRVIIGAAVYLFCCFIMLRDKVNLAHLTKIMKRKHR